MREILQKNLLKITFSIGLLGCTYFHLALHTENSVNVSFDKPQGMSEWVQPVALNAKYPKLISNVSTVYNFAAIEKLLWTIPKSMQGGLAINQQSAKQFELACGFIDNDASQEELQELKLLIQKSMVGDSGIQLSDLQLKYCQFIKEKNLLLASINQSTGDEQITLLKQFMPAIQKRQELLFGVEKVNKLFSLKNLNLAYLTDVRILNLRSDLQPDSKKEQLFILQKNYKNKLSDL